LPGKLEFGKSKYKIRGSSEIQSAYLEHITRADNPLPKKLREEILSLGAFVDKRTFDVMAYPSPEKLALIININLNIAAGLQGR
jgi:flagellar protein FlaF